VVRPCRPRPEPISTQPHFGAARVGSPGGQARAVVTLKVLSELTGKHPSIVRLHLKGLCEHRPAPSWRVDDVAPFGTNARQRA
jgi:hypothetical protein